MISLVEFCIFASLGTLTAAGASHGYHRLRQMRTMPATVTTMAARHDETDRPPPGAWHEPRHFPRHCLNCRIEYIHGDFCTIGTLIDISKQGWRVYAQRPVARGMVMSVNIFLPNQPMPIMIDKAVTRWTHGLEFGLALVEMKPDQAARLSDYLNIRFPQVEQRALPVFPPSYL